jgi:FMN phosphatase YigB (HAD superfamily)
MKDPKLIIFDFDGTILANPDFYRDVYSKSLEKIIAKKRGKRGLEVLSDCRKNFNGKGELALFALNIPFVDWAEMLINAPLEIISPVPDLVSQMKKLNAIKAIYTGSPVKMVYRVLEKLGFSIKDFDLIIGWSEPELFPVKWSSSPLMFEKIMAQFKCSPDQTLAVGDDWDTDLMPAKAIGIKTVQIKKQSGKSDLYFDTLQEFLNNI